ncbi:MAG: DUF4097 family beta strand repeat protein [Chloroflexota bacterium]|nr:DUF4097 family beta strand repeat protein [Chloroflexota bacterium]MDE3102185.1 DUF4097 family beta strand repeat protein [Chloroflexota bacterium]
MSGERDAEREARWAERDARRRERDARRQERAAWHEDFPSLAGLGRRIREEIGRSVGEGLKLGADAGDAGGPSSSEVVDQTFSVSGIPRVTVKNVSGETHVSVGATGQVAVHAVKRVSGWSEDRSRRLLENVEIRLEQSGDGILIEPRLFAQERGWLELFRGGRVSVDLDVTVPRETQLDATTVSGELSLSGTRGPAELRSVSGEITVTDVQGPMRLRSVSGDLSVSGYAGQLEANTVSGEVTIDGSRVRSPDIVTVSGDVDIDAITTPADGSEGRVKTVSGDVELCLADADAEVEFHTTTGDAEADAPARIVNEGRRDRRIIVGSGRGRVRVRTISGDLCCRCADDRAAPPEPSPVAEEPIPMAAPAAPSRSDAARDVLARVARGELSVDEAAAALDAARGGDGGGL